MSEQIITVSITLVVDSLGTTEDFHFSTRGFASKPTDTPANTVFDPRVIDAGEYRRELFSGARVAGLSRPSFGSITLSNHDGALDEWMGYGVSGAPVIVRLGPIGGNFPGDFATVFRAYAKTPTVDFASVVIPLEDRSVLFDRPIVTEVFDGRDAFVIGSPTKKKPLVLGRPGYVPLVLVDPVLSIYYVQSNAVDASFLAGARVVYDGGMPLTYGGLYATPLEGVTVAPAPGHFRAWANTGTTGNAGTTVNSFGPCYVRPGSPPAFDVRIDALGLYLENPADPIRWWTFPDLVRRAGATDVTAATLAPGSYPANVGNFYIDADQTYAEILSDSAQPTFSAFGFDRLDRFFTFDLKDPNEDATEPVVFTFTVNNARNFRRQAVPGQEKPVRQVNVSAGRTWPGSVANGATPEKKELFAREPWQTQFTVTSDGVLTAHPGAISVDVVVQGAVQATDADKLAFGQKYITLYGGLRELITLECTQFDAETIGIELGAKVAIRMPRFLCDSGRNFRVVTQTINLRTRTVSFGLWGGTPGPSDAVLGGGTGTPTTARDYFLTRIPAPETFALIAVQDVAMLALGPTPAPTVYSIIEGGSSLVGPDPLVDDWSPTGDPHWSDVIFLSYFERPDGLSASGSYDESDYHRSVGATALTVTATDPIQGGTSLNFNGSNPQQSAAYNVGAEGIIGTRDWTIELVIDADAVQTGSTPILIQIAPQLGPNWQAGNAVLHLTHSSPYQLAVSFWVYNFSSTTPMLYGTTDLRGGGVAHVGVSRSGNDWYLGIKGAIEDTATWSGSVNSAALYRYIGGTTIVGGSFMRGLADCVRETMDVGRYTGPYSPPWGGPGGGGGDPLTPLETTLELGFDGANGATTTTDSSVYAWPVTLSGGATLSTTQVQTGSASLYCNGTGGRAVVGPTGDYVAGVGHLIMRVWPISTSSDSVLWTRDSGSGSPLKVEIVSGQVRVTYNGLSVPLVMTASPTLTLSTWTLIEVGFRNPGISGALGSIDLRIDGTVYASIGWPLGAGPAREQLTSITIGADYDGTSGFNGYIDAVSMSQNDMA